MVNQMDCAPNGSPQVEECSEKAMMSQMLSRSQPNDVFIYRQDVIRCSKYEGLLGCVMEVAGDSDSDGSITDDSDSEDDGDRNDGGDSGDNGADNNNNDDGDGNDSLTDGQVRVVWTDGSETTDNIGDVTVVDRGFLHGDIVASISDPTGQLGLVVDVSIKVDLLAANGELIKQVSSKDLKRIREFTVGDYVVCGPWLGRVDDVLDNVTVLFDDGSVCKVVKADPLRLQPVSKPIIDDGGCPYYPGQRVRAVSSSVFKTSRWLSGLWKANRLEGTVIKVQTASVVVYWMASAYLGIPTKSSSVPSQEQNPKDLTLLHCFSYANWQLGDWCLLPASSVVDGTSKSSNLKKPIEISDNKQLKDCPVGEQNDIDCSHIENSGEDLDTSGLVKDRLASDAPNHVEADMDESDEYTHDGHDLQLVSGPNTNGCDANSISKPEMNNSVDHEKATTLSNGTPRDLLPEGGSCSSSSSVSKETAHESWPSYRRRLRKVLLRRDKKARRRDEIFERALFIVNTMTKVDVAWQDGTKEYGVDSTSLIPIHSPSDHEFFPEQYVVEKASNEGDDSSETKHVGIVRSVNAKERTVCVRWLKPVSRPEDPREFDFDEVVSAYELDEHSDYDYCYGDVVVRLSPILPSGNTDSMKSIYGDHEQQADPIDGEGDVNEKHSNYGQDDRLLKDEACADFTCLSWVGNITGLQDGDVEVTWADGMVSKVGPQAIYVVGRDDDDDGDSFDGGSEVSDDGASWETVDENETGTLVNIEKEDDLQIPTNTTPEKAKNHTISPEDNSHGRNGPLSMPLAALGFVTRFATGLFSRSKRQLDSDHMVVNETESQETQEVSNKEVFIEERGHVKSDNLNGHSVLNVPDSVEESSHVAVTQYDQVTVKDIDCSMPSGIIVGSTRADTQDDCSTFKHFDIAESPLDHYFLGSSAQGTGERKWVRKVQQEWGILEKNLPDDIYVRVFEDRMDLLRAVIIGACGTPYQDGLFFFDFYLPPEYPQVPPSAYYHSGGLRVNPNLYVDGKVCLSLLNTWTGKGNEVWDPSSSSILQVLVSLQGLVLNSKPYFNEAGYDKQVGTSEGEKNSLPYNENAYLLNLKSMTYLLRRPPMHFEGFVKHHFQQRGHYILKACGAYRGGCLIGTLTEDACMTEKSKEHCSSVGFKLMLDKILPRLITALKEVGVECHPFEYLQNSENLPRN